MFPIQPTRVARFVFAGSLVGLVPTIGLYFLFAHAIPDFECATNLQHNHGLAVAERNDSDVARMGTSNLTAYTFTVQGKNFTCYANSPGIPDKSEIYYLKSDPNYSTFDPGEDLARTRIRAFLLILCTMLSAFCGLIALTKTRRSIRRR